MFYEHNVNEKDCADSEKTNKKPDFPQTHTRDICVCRIAVMSPREEENGASAFASDASAGLISRFEREEFGLSQALNRC